MIDMDKASELTINFVHKIGFDKNVPEGMLNRLAEIIDNVFHLQEPNKIDYEIEPINEYYTNLFTRPHQIFLWGMIFVGIIFFGLIVGLKHLIVDFTKNLYNYISVSYYLFKLWKSI